MNIKHWREAKKPIGMESKHHFYTIIFVTLLPAIFLFSGCSENERSDAYGHFEATETTISSKSAGELLSFAASEGERMERNFQAAVIDTTLLGLQRQEVQTQIEATASKIATIDAQISVQNEELQTALKNKKRISALVEDSAATPQQLDDIEGKVQAIKKQIDVLNTQKKSVSSEIAASRKRLKQINQKIEDSRIVNPVNGTVLTTFVEPHEFVGVGQPLYRIANLDTLELRVYISGAQLPSLKLGQQVEVLADKNAEENQTFSGRVSWIASEAEFTPKMIQTKEERVTQVYAVKVKVPNPDGILKIGMPGEINF